MSMTTVKKAENQLNVTFLFEIGKLASLLSLIVANATYIVTIAFLFGRMFVR